MNCWIQNNEFQRLFPNPSWLTSGRTSGHQKLVATFPWIDNCLMWWLGSLKVGYLPYAIGKQLSITLINLGRTWMLEWRWWSLVALVIWHQLQQKTLLLLLWICFLHLKIDAVNYEYETHSEKIIKRIQINKPSRWAHHDLLGELGNGCNYMFDDIHLVGKHETSSPFSLDGRLDQWWQIGSMMADWINDGREQAPHSVKLNQ